LCSGPDSCTVFAFNEYTAPTRGDHLMFGGFPCVSGAPLTPAYIRPPVTVRAGVPATGSAGIVTTLVIPLSVAAGSKPTVKLLFTSRIPPSCSMRRP
jgi:hypothetical protein